MELKDGRYLKLSGGTMTVNRTLMELKEVTVDSIAYHLLLLIVP